MKHIPMVKPIMGFQKRPKDGAESTGLVDINKVKHSQRHLLATIENNRLVLPIFTIGKMLTKL